MVEVAEIKTGFKQTEVGLIPEDWEVVILDELTSRIGDGIHSTPVYTENGNYFFVNGNNLKAGKIVITDETKRVSKDEYFKQKRDLNDSTLLLSINGTIGNVAYFKNENLLLGKSAAYLNINKRAVKGYLFYAIQTETTQRFFDDQLTGSTIKNLGLGTIRVTPIPLPPTKAEQTAIATALSDMDALIEAQGKLIAKKRAIKQGAMQELLKPKEGWEVKTLEEITDCLDNLRVPLNEEQRSKMKGDIPYCGANGIVDYVNDYVIDDKIILIAEDGGYFDEYLTRPIAYQMEGKCWVNNHAHILKAKKGQDQDFIFYSLVHKNILSFLASGTRAKLNKSQMYRIEIYVPATEAEQTSIACILSDMDTEIDQLENQLAKNRQVKVGMMQELLTGKKRLIEAN